MQLCNPNIAQLLDGPCVAVAMEVATFDLRKFMKASPACMIPAPLALITCDHVLRGLRWLRTLGFMHRDWKPVNLLVYATGAGDAGYQVRVGDMGSSRELTCNAMTIGVCMSW